MDVVCIVSALATLVFLGRSLLHFPNWPILFFAVLAVSSFHFPQSFYFSLFFSRVARAMTSLTPAATFPLSTKRELWVSGHGACGRDSWTRLVWLTACETHWMKNFRLFQTFFLTNTDFTDSRELIQKSNKQRKTSFWRISNEKAVK